MLADALYLVVLAFSTFIIQLIGLPIVLLIFGKKSALPEWWAWGRMAGWLATGLVIWLLSNLQLPLNTAVGFWLVLVGLATGLYAYKPWKIRSTVKNFLRTYPKEILFQESLFLAGFIFLGLVRTFHPAVIDLEKFMNAGLIQGYLRSPTLPAIDMWLAGETINYYSYGHFLGSLMLRFWNLPVEVGFNILPGWMLGLMLVQTSALTQTLLRKFVTTTKHFSWPLIVGGLISAALVCFGGNSHPIWYLITTSGFQDYWYPEAVRLIEHTIHEIPAYSFIVSDLHAHFWSLSIVLFTIFAVWQWLQFIGSYRKTAWQTVWRDSGLWRRTVTVGALLGVLGMTNTWDMLMYGILLLLLGLMAIAVSTKKLLPVAVSGFQVAASALLVFSTWWWHFSSITQGVFFVTEQSPLWQLAALWAGHVVFSVLAAVVAWQFLEKPARLRFPAVFLVGFGMSAWMFLLLPEFVYFKDIYPTFPRANTMFKFTYQAFVMMSILIGWLGGWLLQKRNFLESLPRWTLFGAISLFTMLVSAYAVYGYRSYYGDFRRRESFDGLAWLRSQSSAEYDAVLWLRSHTIGRPVVLEAVGDSYTTFGRVSVFSGLPTPLGWRAHEWLWRGGYDIPKERTDDVAFIYQYPENPRSQTLLDRYQVQFIMVGSKEREQYQFVLEDVLELGEIVFQEGNVIILQR